MLSHFTAEEGEARKSKRSLVVGEEEGLSNLG